MASRSSCHAALPVADFLSVTSAGLFAGGALIISIAEQPARLGMKPMAALGEWRASYSNAALWKAANAALSCVCGVVSTWLGGGPLMAVGGCLVGSNIPFTLFVIMPTNKSLKSRECEDEFPKIKSLLRIWGQLHNIRSFLGLAGFMVLTAGLVTRGKR